LKALTAGCADLAVTNEEQAMAVKRAVIAAIVGQFGHPRGAAGSVVGWVMAHRRSNRQRHSRVVALPGVQPTEKVPEIGFGPGLAIAGLSRCAGGTGRVSVIGHSEVMLRQAARRNGAAIAAGRVTLSRASVDQLPPALGGLFDAIVAVNSLGLWPAPASGLSSYAGGCDPAGASPSPPSLVGGQDPAARQIQVLLQGAGYTTARTEALDLEPAVACVLTASPDPACSRSPPASGLTS